jgi:hypothetical protein
MKDSSEKLKYVAEGVEDKIRKLFSSSAPYSTIIHSNCVPELFLLREVRHFMFSLFNITFYFAYLSFLNHVHVNVFAYVSELLVSYII